MRATTDGWAISRPRRDSSFEIRYPAVPAGLLSVALHGAVSWLRFNELTMKHSASLGWPFFATCGTVPLKNIYKLSCGS
jgi:hypothetical protein